MEEQEGKYVIDRAAEAVGDTMMMVRASYNLYRSPSDKNPEPTTLDALDRQAYEASQGRCHWSSAEALHYLTQRQDIHFPHLFLLKTQYSKDRLLHYDTLEEAHWVFVAQSEEGRWFIGSPANHRPKNSPLETLFQSPDLQTVLTRLKTAEGGDWPSAKILTDKLNEKYQPPTISPQKGMPFDVLYVTQVEQNSGKTSADRVPMIVNKTRLYGGQPSR